MEKVFLGIPTTDHKVHADLVGMTISCTSRKILRYLRTHSYSCLTRNFNELFCAALNARETEGITHFCMVHADVVPKTPNWLDIMVDTMNAYDADILSVIIPIKDKKGLTSTALENNVSVFRPDRISIEAAFNDYPVTWTHPKLLVNTGLMLIDIRNPWVENICFRFCDQIVKEGNNFIAENIPEDWLFSQDAKMLGAKIYATRVIEVMHFGYARFMNTLYPNTNTASQ